MAVVQEQFRETTRFLTWAKEQLAIGAAVMGCLEEKLREALRQDARRCLEELLNDPAVKEPGDHTRAGESCHARRVNTVDSLFGPLTLRRNYYSQRDPAGGRAPLDESMGVVEGCTPGLARMMCRAGALEPYVEASQSLEIDCGLRQGDGFNAWSSAWGRSLRSGLRQPAHARRRRSFTWRPMAPFRPARETVAGRQRAGRRDSRIKLGVVFTQASPESTAKSRPEEV